MKKWLVLGLIVVGCVFLLTVTRSPTPASKPAPDFLLPDLNGQVVCLSQLKGKVVMLNVWTTWCPPCRKEMPTMEALYRRLIVRGTWSITTLATTTGLSLRWKPPCAG